MTGRNKRSFFIVGKEGTGLRSLFQNLSRVYHNAVTCISPARVHTHTSTPTRTYYLELHCYGKMHDSHGWHFGTRSRESERFNSHALTPCFPGVRSSPTPVSFPTQHDPTPCWFALTSTVQINCS